MPMEKKQYRQIMTWEQKGLIFLLYDYNYTWEEIEDVTGYRKGRLRNMGEAFGSERARNESIRDAKEKLHGIDRYSKGRWTTRIKKYFSELAPPGECSVQNTVRRTSNKNTNKKSFSKERSYYSLARSTSAQGQSNRRNSSNSVNSNGRSASSGRIERTLKEHIDAV